MSSAHTTFTLNNAGTRIRCNGPECLSILDVATTPEAAFEQHLVDVQPTDPVDDLWAVDDEVVAAALMYEANSPAPESAEQQMDPTPVQDVEPAIPVVAEEVIENNDEPAAVEIDTLLEATVEPDTEIVVAAPIKKRNIKAITETLATIKNGDRVSATFKQPRYGEFTIEATVVAGLTHLSQLVGMWHIGSAGKPSRQLVGLVRLAAKGKHDLAIEPGSESAEHLGATA